MEIKRFDLGQARELVSVRNKKMKTVIVWFMYYMPLDENASVNALLSRLMLKGSSNYRNIREIARFLCENYGAEIGVDVGNKGEIYTLSLYTRFINSNIISVDKNLMSNILQFFNDIVFNSLVRDDTFLGDCLELEKKNLVAVIDNKINNKDTYALNRCTEIMCKNEPYSIDRLGRREWAESINSRDIVGRYNELIDNIPLKIYIMGDLEGDDALDLINSYFRLGNGRSIGYVNEIAQGNRVKNESEVMDISQSRLCLGLRTGVNLKSPEYPALVVYNNILGSGPQSKLFAEIREKESLCYNVYSMLEKYKGLMFINCGIDGDKKSMVVEKIISIVDQIKSGGFSDEEFECALSSARKDIQMIKDNTFNLLSYIQGLDIYESDYTIDDFSIRLGETTRTEIIDVCKKIELDTIFFLGNR